MDNAVQLIKLLRDNNMTISSAESLTGGMVSSALVSVPGASYAFMEGFVTYDIHAKERTLGIDKRVLDEESAISPVTARLMAEGAMKKAGTDVAMATTGNAGPDPSEGKPVGLVYTACCIKGKAFVTEHEFIGDRAAIRQAAAEAVISECITELKKYLEQS